MVTGGQQNCEQRSNNASRQGRPETDERTVIRISTLRGRREGRRYNGVGDDIGAFGIETSS